ncbi:AraC family transcriptional regulator [Croceicoccus bisphenolivorans]|uniref:AraC family transcriptional regulator n=1 Tax=Croceicoccus bisphenolivorans TaxID=1783232 RepID=UPI0008330C66|nr:AraC family transcriptional regulator [Croceicoccus bisphenolivorans]
MTSARTIPAYSLFGQPAGLVEPRFCHVERIGDRWKLHAGLVERHSHPHLHQMTLWIAGSGEYYADEEVSTIRAGTCCWMPAGAVHGFAVEAGSESIVLSMSDDFAREQFAGLSQFTPFHTWLIQKFDAEQRGWIGSLFARMEREYGSTGPGQVQSIGSLARLVIVDMLRMAEDHAGGTEERGGESSLLVRFMSLVEMRLGERPGVEALADELGTTPYLLNRACKAGLDMRASDVVRARHLQEAKRLLLFTVLDVGEIGALVGYPDPAHFARTFRTATGQTPRQWRDDRMRAIDEASARDRGE